MTRSAGYRWTLVGLAAICSVVWMTPLALVVGASLKSPAQMNAGGFFGLSGSIGQFVENITQAAELSSFWQAFGNSLIYGIVGAGAAVLSASLAAYALVWLRVKHSFFWFMVIYSGTVFPFQMYIIPLSAIFKQTGLYDSRQGMIIFYIAICVPFCTFVFRSYYMGMPSEMFEAAKLDGASSFRVFSRIVLPLSGGPAALLFLTQFTWVWNDLLFGQVLTTSSEYRPIMPALTLLAGTTVSIGTVGQRMSAALVASLPALVLFIVLRDKFMQGLVLQTRER